MDRAIENTTIFALDEKLEAVATRTVARRNFFMGGMAVAGRAQRGSYPLSDLGGDGDHAEVRHETNLSHRAPQSFPFVAVAGQATAPDRKRTALQNELAVLDQVAAHRVAGGMLKDVQSSPRNDLATYTICPTW